MADWNVSEKVFRYIDRLGLPSDNWLLEDIGWKESTHIIDQYVKWGDFISNFKANYDYVNSYEQAFNIKISDDDYDEMAQKLHDLYTGKTRDYKKKIVLNIPDNYDKLYEKQYNKPNRGLKYKFDPSGNNKSSKSIDIKAEIEDIDSLLNEIDDIIKQGPKTGKSSPLSSYFKILTDQINKNDMKSFWVFCDPNDPTIIKKDAGRHTDEGKKARTAIKKFIKARSDLWNTNIACVNLLYGASPEKINNAADDREIITIKCLFHNIDNEGNFDYDSANTWNVIVNYTKSELDVFRPSYKCLTEEIMRMLALGDEQKLITDLFGITYTEFINKYGPGCNGKSVGKVASKVTSRLPRTVSKGPKQKSIPKPRAVKLTEEEKILIREAKKEETRLRNEEKKRIAKELREAKKEETKRLREAKKEETRLRNEEKKRIAKQEALARREAKKEETRLRNEEKKQIAKELRTKQKAEAKKALDLHKKQVAKDASRATGKTTNKTVKSTIQKKASIPEELSLEYDDYKTSLMLLRRYVRYFPDPSDIRNGGSEVIENVRYYLSKCKELIDNIKDLHLELLHKGLDKEILENAMDMYDAKESMETYKTIKKLF